MRTQSMDTSPEAERVQIELIRKASPAKRFTIMEAWSQFLIEANKQGIRKNRPDWAVALKVSDLLERALVDAGLAESK
ncbi:MAG: hypothetical protein E6J48_00870 [Chloroflexi bacterium]|nr:MAG: hypothetical protein E6J48_00870 [Chloroflexota bacterium]